MNKKPAILILFSVYKKIGFIDSGFFSQKITDIGKLPTMWVENIEICKSHPEPGNTFYFLLWCFKASVVWYFWNSIFSIILRRYWLIEHTTPRLPVTGHKEAFLIINNFNYFKNLAIRLDSNQLVILVIHWKCI